MCTYMILIYGIGSYDFPQQSQRDVFHYFFFIIYEMKSDLYAISLLWSLLAEREQRQTEAPLSLCAYTYLVT